MPKTAAHEVGRCWQLAFQLLVVASATFFSNPLIADESSPKADATQSPETSEAATATTTVGVEDQAPVAETAAVTAQAVPEPVAVDLLQGELRETWKYFSSKEGVPIGDVWTVTRPGEDKHKQLNCIGEPKGFLYTKKQYSNFVLTFEWQVSEDNANSGVLVYTQDEPRLWPTSMQVQLHQPQAGDIFPSGDAEGNATQAPPELAKEVGTWNKCEIVSFGGQLSVKINGRKAGEVSGCQPATGSIALQSEGSKTLFRRLLLKELTAPPVPEAVEQTTEVEEPAEKAKAPVTAKAPPAS